MPKFLVKAKLQKLFVIDAPNEEDAKGQVMDKELETFIVFETTELNTSNIFIEEEPSLSIDSGGSLRAVNSEKDDNITQDEDGGDQ
jgi:hypothetical protein